MIGEAIAQVVFEFVGYATGRAILSVVTPQIQIPPLLKGAQPQTRKGWLSLTYKRGGQRYYYDDSVAGVGVIFWVVVIVAVAIARAS